MNTIQRLLFGLVPAALLVTATGCTVSGEEYAEPAPAAYYEGPTYYRSPDVYYDRPGYRYDHDRWDHDRRLYSRQRVYVPERRVEHRDGVHVDIHRDRD